MLQTERRKEANGKISTWYAEEAVPNTNPGGKSARLIDSELTNRRGIKERKMGMIVMKKGISSFLARIFNQRKDFDGFFPSEFGNLYVLYVERKGSVCFV